MAVSINLDVFDIVPGASAAIVTPAVGVAATDTFTRANELPLAGNWSTAGPNAFNLAGQSVSPASAAPITPPGAAAVYWTATPFAADHYAQCTIVLTGVGPRGGPAVRIAPTSAALSCYAAEADPDTGTLRLYKYVASTATLLATYPGAGQFNDTIRLSILRSTLEASRNGAVIGSVIDTELTTGLPGLYGRTNTLVLDNWEAEAEYGPVTSTVQWFQEPAMPSESQVGTGAASALNRRTVAYVRRDEVANLTAGATIEGGPAQLVKTWRVHSVDTSDPDYFIAVVL